MASASKVDMPQIFAKISRFRTYKVTSHLCMV